MMLPWGTARLELVAGTSKAGLVDNSEAKEFFLHPLNLNQKFTLKKKAVWFKTGRLTRLPDEEHMKKQAKVCTLDLLEMSILQPARSSQVRCILRFP